MNLWPELNAHCPAWLKIERGKVWKKMKSNPLISSAWEWQLYHFPALAMREYKEALPIDKLIKLLSDEAVNNLLAIEYHQ